MACVSDDDCDYNYYCDSDISDSSGEAECDSNLPITLTVGLIVIGFIITCFGGVLFRRYQMQRNRIIILSFALFIALVLCYILITDHF